MNRSCTPPLPSLRWMLIALAASVATACATVPPPVISRSDALYGQGPATRIETRPLTPIKLARPIALSAESTTIALLLPQSGRFAGVADTVRDGFMAAYLDSPIPRPALKVYDTGELRPSMLDAYDHAVADGAALIVGPLLKEQVEALADMRESTIPVLALNYLDSALLGREELFQLGLSPEDEARQAAESAIANGLRRAVALSEATAWGTRNVAVFQQRYEALGGQVITSRSFPEHTVDPSAPIRELLQGSGGNAPPDIDMVFVAADADESRMVMPVLRFYWARKQNLVVYATSAVYDRPIDSRIRMGLRFCDMPLVLPAAIAARSPQRERVAAAFAGAGIGRSRLLGFGYDAYRVGMAALESRLSSGTSLRGVTGTLVLQADGSIRRKLPCAEIANGQLNALETSAVSPSHN